MGVNLFNKKSYYTYDVLVGDYTTNYSDYTTTDLHLLNELVFVTHKPNNSFFCQLTLLLAGEWKYCLLHE